MELQADAAGLAPTFFLAGTIPVMFFAAPQRLHRDNMRRAFWGYLNRRSDWRDTTTVRSILSLAAVATASFAPTTAAAQGNRTKVTYTVEFQTTGALLDQTCSATGTDVLAGTIVGFEPPLPGEDNEYVGTLTRTTRITTCGTRRNAAGVDAVCSINYVGNGFADVKFTLYEGERGGYLEYITNRAEFAALLPPRRPGRSTTWSTEPATRRSSRNCKVSMTKGRLPAARTGSPSR